MWSSWVIGKNVSKRFTIVVMKYPCMKFSSKKKKRKTRRNKWWITLCMTSMATNLIPLKKEKRQSLKRRTRNEIDSFPCFDRRLRRLRQPKQNRFERHQSQNRTIMRRTPFQKYFQRTILSSVVAYGCQI